MALVLQQFYYDALVRVPVSKHFLVVWDFPQFTALAERSIKSQVSKKGLKSGIKSGCNINGKSSTGFSHTSMNDSRSNATRLT